jgi:lactoylglutathione lyase
MGTPMSGIGNVRQAVPFFAVADMPASLAFYVDGLGFEIKRRWTPEGRLRWCWLERGNAALMLQEETQPSAGKRGDGVTICFICEDAIAIYRDVTARGIRATIPFVGNNMWVTSVSDPDGYKLDFESETDVPEETVYSEPFEEGIDHH